MRMRFVSTRASRRATAFAVTAAVTVAGVAGASWSASSNGNARAQAGRLQAVTASPATTSSELFPGGTADAALTLTNPNPVAMTVSSIVGNGAITSDSAACNEAGHGVTFSDQTGAWEVAKSAALTVSLTDAVRMALESDDACQGATFTIPVAVTASVSGQGGAGSPTTTTTTAPAQLAWSPPSYTYPPTEVETPTYATFSLRNSGGAPTGIETGQMGNADFAVQSATCPASLQPGQACSYTIRFAPTSPGAKSATFNVRVPGTSSWTTLNVGGWGNTAAFLVVDPSSWNFGDVAVGTNSAVKTFTVRNTGQSPARNLFTQFGGPDTASFSWAGGTCSTTSELPPNGGSCTVGVIFRPNSPGPKSATMRATYNNATTATAQLSGTGV